MINEELEKRIKILEKIVDDLKYLATCNGWKFEEEKVKKSGWINIYKNINKIEEALYKGVYQTEDAANYAKEANRIACVKVEWEE